MALDINIIVSEGSQMNDANDVVNSTEVPATEDDKNEAKKKGSNSATATAVLANYALSVAKSMVKQTANYFISDIGRSSGDSNLQNVINKRVEQASELLSLGGGTVAGATLGAKFGPVGAAVGAVIGLAASGASLIIKDKEKERAYEHEMFKQNTNQAYNLSRANFSALSGRLR